MDCGDIISCLLYALFSSAGVFSSFSFLFFFFFFFWGSSFLPDYMHGRFRQWFSLEMSDCGPVFTELYLHVSLMTFVIIMGTAWSTGPIFNGFGAGIVQLVERATEKPGAILVVSGAARDFYLSQLPVLPLQTHLRCPYGPLRAIACINLSAHFKNPKHIVWIYKNTHSTQIAMDSAALTAAVPYRVRQPEFPATDNEVLKKKSIHSMAGFGLTKLYFIYNNTLTT